MESCNINKIWTWFVTGGGSLDNACGRDGRDEKGLSGAPSFDWLKMMEPADMEWMGQKILAL